jgi:hypothetical protein
MGDFFNDSIQLLAADINPGLILTRFYHLTIDTKTISSDQLVDILYRLPNIISLKLQSVTLFPLFDEEEGENNFSYVSEANIITKVYLEEMNDIKELDFVLALCRSVNYLQIDSLHNINIESFIREILIRINDHSNQDLCLLCLRIPTADDQFIEKLKEMIDSEEGLVDYTIKRITDKIYLQWG